MTSALCIYYVPHTIVCITMGCPGLGPTAKIARLIITKLGLDKLPGAEGRTIWVNMQSFIFLLHTVWVCRPGLWRWKYCVIGRWQTVSDKSVFSGLNMCLNMSGSVPDRSLSGGHWKNTVCLLWVLCSFNVQRCQVEAWQLGLCRGKSSDIWCRVGECEGTVIRASKNWIHIYFSLL